jgi:hypothetical protein
MAKHTLLPLLCSTLAACSSSGGIHLANPDSAGTSSVRDAGPMFDIMAILPMCDIIGGTLPQDIASGFGPWELGFRSNTSSDFTPYAAFSTNEPGVAGSDGVAWWYTGGANFPGAALNTTDKTISYADITLQAGQFLLHPGAAGEQSIARWTAGDTARVEIRAEFFGLSQAKTTTDVHVYLNDSSLAQGGINIGGAGNLFSYTGQVDVVENDTIDLAVGYGNGNYTSDATGLNISICTL